MIRENDELKVDDSDATQSPNAKPPAKSDNKRSAKRHAERHDERGASTTPKSRARRAAPQANSERSPLTWREDPFWEPEEAVQEAVLTLPVEGYLSWLTSHRWYQPVGVKPSAYENPLSLYLHTAVGVQFRLHTDGRRAWCMLQLTQAIRDTDARYLRLLLPPWTTPLALEYTAFLTGRTSGHPMQKDVSADEAARLALSHASDAPEQ